MKFFPEVPRKAGASLMGADRAFTGASSSQSSMKNWHARRVSIADAISEDRRDLTARAHDLSRNNSWADSGLTKVLDGIIGKGLNYSSKPNAERLGISATQAKDLGMSIERFWQAHLTDHEKRCDAGMRLDGVSLMTLAARSWLLNGDAIGRVHWLERGGVSNTSVELIHPNCLSQPSGQPETSRFRDGIELGKFREPIAYHFLKEHPDDKAGFSFVNETVRVPVFDKDGSRRIFHHFTSKDVSQYRGVSLLAPVIEPLKQLGSYHTAELNAALLNAVMAAFFYSEADHNVISELLEEKGGSKKVGDYLDTLQEKREDFYDENPVDMSGVKVIQMAAGDKVEMSTPARPSGNFSSFQDAVLRNIASHLGLSVDMFSGDYSKTSYSGFQGALHSIWRGFGVQRGSFVSGFVLPWFAAVVEEGIATDQIEVPRGARSFWEDRGAYLSGVWLGPSRAIPDPVKDAKASEINMGLGRETLAENLAEQGKDLESHMEQLTQEIDMFRKRGLVHPYDAAARKQNNAAGSQEVDLSEKPEDE